MSFNYVDAFNSSSNLTFQSKEHDNSVELQGRICYIFLLDRKKTEISEVYNEAVNGRIYLPHFEQRALYNTNEWQNVINFNNFMETEETQNFEFNFARMVCNIRDLKDRKAGTLTIRNISDEVLHLKIEDNKLIVSSLHFVELLNLDLKKYRSIKSLMIDVEKKCSIIKMNYSGDEEEAENISSINIKLYPNRKEEIIVNDRVYQNCGDVINSGDLILTDKRKLYQVNSAYPSGTQINEYTSWTCKCNVIDLALSNLPDDYKKIVTRNQYALPKTDTRP